MKIKTEWNLGLLYKRDNDPQIEKDLKAIEKIASDFEKKYKGKNFTNSPKTLTEALGDYENLREKTDMGKPHRYFAMKTDLNCDDSKAGAMATKCEQKLTAAGNKIRFFTLEIAKIPKEKQSQFLKDSKLANYKYFLQRIFKRAEFNLPEGEEQLAGLLNQTSYGMWTDFGERVLSKQVVTHKGKEMPIAKASTMLQDLPKKERRELRSKINTVLKSISEIAEAEINSVINFKKVMDTRRGFKNPYSATILGYENDEKSIEVLISLISKNFKIAHRFYRLHAKLLGEKTITNADRLVKIGEIKQKFDFETSAKMLRETLEEIDPEYASFLDKFLGNGQIDVYPKKGKRGGAYCGTATKEVTIMLLNHNDNIDGLETLSHEMGHAIHTELANRQPPFSRLYPISTAEVASTFFEQVMLDRVEKNLTDREKVVLLHNKISRDINTIFRQIACFNFEVELHKKIREEGQISKEVIAELMNKHMRSYTGEAVKWEEDDGYTFVSWSHIRRFFYVYSYAYGQIISKALFENWKKDKSYAAKIKQFLKAGRSMSPEDIFKSIGIDTSDPKFFEAGLKSIDRDITRLEKLVIK